MGFRIYTHRGFPAIPGLFKVLLYFSLSQSSQCIPLFRTYEILFIRRLQDVLIQYQLLCSEVGVNIVWALI